MIHEFSFSFEFLVGCPSRRIMDRIYFLNMMDIIGGIEIIFRLIRIIFESMIRLIFDSLHLGIFDSSYSFFVLIG